MPSTYYFDATAGNNANTGLSPRQAWQTLQKFCATAFSAGDVLRFKRGEIFYYLGADGSPLTDNFKHNENGWSAEHYGPAADPPSLRALKLLTGWTDEGSGVWSWNTAWTGSEAGTWAWVDGIACAKLAWNTNVATTFSGAVDLTFATNDAGNVFYVKPGGDPTLFRIEASAAGMVAQQLIGFYDVDDVVFDGVDFRGGYSGMFRLIPGTVGSVNTGLVWRNCTLGRYPANGILMLSDGVTNAAKYSIEVDRCLFTECPEAGSIGIFPRDCVAATGHIIDVERTEFYKCDHGIQLGNRTGGTGGHCTGSVRRCLFRETRDDAIWSPGNAPTSGTMDIDCNVIIASGDQGIQLIGGLADEIKSHRVRHNTVVGCNQEGLLLYGCDSSCVAKNNLLANNNRQHVATQRTNDYDHSIEVAATGGGVDYNLVHSDKNNVTGKFLVTTRVDNPATAPSIYDDNWAGYVAASGQDANSVNANPRLAAVTPARIWECRLRGGSPAIGAGTDLGVAEDYFGRPIRADAVDIGAIQFVPAGGMGRRGPRLAGRPAGPGGRIG